MVLAHTRVLLVHALDFNRLMEPWLEPAITNVEKSRAVAQSALDKVEAQLKNCRFSTYAASETDHGLLVTLRSIDHALFVIRAADRFPGPSSLCTIGQRWRRRARTTRFLLRGT
jgi:hypothetical protein